MIRGFLTTGAGSNDEEKWPENSNLGSVKGSSYCRSDSVGGLQIEKIRQQRDSAK